MTVTCNKRCTLPAGADGEEGAVSASGQWMPATRGDTTLFALSKGHVCTFRLGLYKTFLLKR